MTDNRNRTAGEVRATFTKSGGNLAETGAVSFMFDHFGVIEYDAEVASAEAMFEAALEAGADDVVSSESGHEIYAAPDQFGAVAKALEAKFGEPRKASLVWRPQNTVARRRRAGRKAAQADRELNEHDDVQNVYANFEISDALVQKHERLAATNLPTRPCYEPGRHDAAQFAFSASIRGSAAPAGAWSRLPATGSSFSPAAR